MSICLEAKWPSIFETSTLGPNSNQINGHLGSRYIYIYIYNISINIQHTQGVLWVPGIYLYDIHIVFIDTLHTHYNLCWSHSCTVKPEVFCWVGFGDCPVSTRCSRTLGFFSTRDNPGLQLGNSFFETVPKSYRKQWFFGGPCQTFGNKNRYTAYINLNQKSSNPSKKCEKKTPFSFLLKVGNSSHEWFNEFILQPTKRTFRTLYQHRCRSCEVSKMSAFRVTLLELCCSLGAVWGIENETGGFCLIQAMKWKDVVSFWRIVMIFMLLSKGKSNL